MLDQVFAGFGALLAPWVRPAAILAGCSLAVTLALWAIIGRRRFNRRNFAGVEEFDSYGSAVGHGLFEALLEFVAAPCLVVFMLSMLVVIFGLLLAKH